MKELQTTLTVYKNEGETPLECLDRLRVEHPEYKDAVLSYAGRLDPMAEGEMLILVNDVNKEREKYLGLDKEYEVDVLFGVETDTGDILGVVNKTFQKRGDINFLRSSATLSTTEANISPLLKSFVGTVTQKYPSYSSKAVNGKPLFQWAREDRLDEIEIPEKTSEIYSIELMDQYKLNSEEILEKVKERVGKVKGDFRQAEILRSWEDLLASKAVESFNLIKIKVRCSSGTYMRTLAESMALKLGTVGIAWKIKRTLLFSSK